MFFLNAHSSESRFRGEVVCSPEKRVACVDIGVALHPSSASRELVLSHFDQFLFLFVLHVKNVRNGFPEYAKAPLQIISVFFARKAHCWH
jgi:hypothetical protein